MAGVRKHTQALQMRARAVASAQAPRPLTCATTRGGEEATARLLTGADVSRQLTAHKGAGAREQVPHTKTGRART